VNKQVLRAIAGIRGFSGKGAAVRFGVDQCPCKGDGGFGFVPPRHKVTQLLSGLVSN